MTETNAKLAEIFLAFSRDRLMNRQWPRMKACVEPLTVEQVWWRPNEASNSIGNLLLHLNGNVTQWLVDSFDRNEDKRDRPAEFAADGGLTAAELLQRLGATLDKVDDRGTAGALRDPGLYGARARRCLPGGGALRDALRAGCLYYEELAGQGSWVLSGSN